MTVATAEQQTTIRATRRQITQIGYGVAFSGFLFLVMARVLTHSNGEFGTYWASGRAATLGLNPYALYPQTVYLDPSQYGLHGLLPNFNLNPPIVLPLFRLLSHLSLDVFITAWTIMTAVLFTVGVGLLIINQRQLQARQAVWLLLGSPATVTVWCGQIYGLLFFLSTLAWFFNKKGRNVAAALAIGLAVAIKPTLVLWLVILFIAGHRKLAMRSATVSAISYAIPLVIYGPTIYREWLAVLHDDFHWMIPTNMSLIPFFTRIGLRFVGIIVAVSIASAIAIWCYKMRPDFVAASGLGICAAILCGPLAWHQYIIFLGSFFVSRPWGRLATLAAIPFLIPGRPWLAGSGLAYVIATGCILLYFLVASTAKADNVG